MNRDATLIEKTLDGQSEAFAELVKKYQLPVYAIALQRTKSKARTRVETKKKEKAKK